MVFSCSTFFGSFTIHTFDMVPVECSTPVPEHGNVLEPIHSCLMGGRGPSKKQMALWGGVPFSLAKTFLEFHCLLELSYLIFPSFLRFQTYILIWSLSLLTSPPSSPSSLFLFHSHSLAPSLPLSLSFSSFQSLTQACPSISETSDTVLSVSQWH